MVRKTKPRLIQRIRKGLRVRERAAKRQKKPFFEKTFKIERELINTPSSFRKLKRIAPKPLIDAPQQLTRGKRVRSFGLMFDAIFVEVNIGRKRRRKR